MVSWAQGLDVMRPNSHAPRRAEPRPAYSASQVLLVSAAMLAALVALLVAVSHPVAVAGAVALLVAVRLGGGALARLVRARDGDRRRGYCIPGTDICLRV